MLKINSSTLLLPPLTFRIGIVGHRPNRLVDADPPLLAKVMEQILTNSKEAVYRIWKADSKWYSGDAPVLQAMSSLAEGSDRIFALEAMKLGYSLSCPMPFPQEEFEADFAPGKALEPDSLSRFREILDQAGNTVGLTRFELAGERSQESQAYRIGGQMVLTQSDLLVIVWDGVSRMAEGGTEDMLKEAIRLDIPVAWIDARKPHRWMLLDETRQVPTPGKDGRHVPGNHEDSAKLADVITGSLALPDTGVSHTKKEKPARRRLSDFYTERTSGRSPAVLWRIFQSLLGKGKWNSVFSFFKSGDQSDTSPLIQGFEKMDPAISRVVQSGFERCDFLSGYYGDYYRSGYILTFLLAALAVGLALFPVVAGWLTHGNKTGESIMVALELVTLLGILLLVFRSRSRRWHGRWLDYRLAAEWIRQLKLLAPLGMGIRVHETKGHQKSYEHPSATWMAWYVKALDRNLGLPDARVDEVYLKKYLDDLIELTRDQQSYHANNAQKNHLIERRLHRSGIILVGATIAACSTHLLPLLIPGIHWPEGFAFFLTFLCGFLPALGAALAGINNQGEFKTLAKTSESMHQEYSGLSEELAGLKEALQMEEDQPVMPVFKKIRGAAYRISRLMIEELSDWRITYHNRPPELPV